MNMDCPFCEIDESRTKVLFRGRYCFVCLSNPYLMEGHLLVIPNRHVEKLSELNEEEREELFSLVVEFEEKVLEKVSGCDVRINYRPFQKQGDLKVDHLHVHLQPRELYDELYEKCQVYEKDLFRFLKKEKERDN